MKKIQDIVCTLSSEEQEKFKDLIEECQSREDELINSQEKIGESIEQLKLNFEKAHNSFCEIEQSILKLKDELKAIEVLSDVTIDKNDLN